MSDYPLTVEDLRRRINEYYQPRIEELEAGINLLDCEGEWCGKSPTKHDNGKCRVCKLQEQI